MRVDSLKPNPKNPRKISDTRLAQLKRSLEEYGDISGVVFNVRSGNLVTGHQRNRNFDDHANVVITKTFDKPTKTGTLKLGYIEHNGERFSYREVDWPKSKETAAGIAANNNAGDWDLPELKLQLKELASFDVDFDLDLTMFEPGQLEDFGVVEVGAYTRHSLTTGIDEDEIPEKTEPRVKTGELWQLGNHRLLCGDCTVRENVESLMDGEKADLWVTDPPYGVDYIEKNSSVNGGIVHNMQGKVIENDSGKSVKEMCPFWRAAAEVAFENTTEKASHYWFACQGSDKMMMMMMMLDEVGWNIRHELIWVKSSFVFGRSDYHYQHEPIIYGWKKKGTHEWFGDRKQCSVFQIDRPHRSDLHPTTKPVELIEHFATNSSEENQSIYDSFLGSGSTLIACEKTNRRCYGMEIDPGYCSVILDRWEKYTGKTAKLIEKGIYPKAKKTVSQSILSRA